jgi:hypothetical protein
MGSPSWTRDMEKQVGERINIVMCNPRLASVYRRFGGEVFRRSSVFHGLEKFLRKAGVRGKRCYEVGTWNGLTAIVLAEFFDEVVTVDIAHNPAKHRIIEHVGATNIRCIDLKDNADKWKVLRGLEFDCAYLDGNHAEDTETDFAMTRHCGQVLFHEAWEFQLPVWSLLHSLPPTEVAFNGCGLALWRATPDG